MLISSDQSFTNHLSPVDMIRGEVVDFIDILFLLKSLDMNKLIAVLAIVILGILGFYAFKFGWILTKVFIGLEIIFVFALGVIAGRISKK
jgi:hypothetical protein